MLFLGLGDYEVIAPPHSYINVKVCIIKLIFRRKCVFRKIIFKVFLSKCFLSSFKKICQKFVLTFCKLIIKKLGEKKLYKT